MTGLLKDTLAERAAAVDEPPLNLDAIIQTGNTRIRRRRTTTIVAVAVASALVLVGGVVTAKNLATPDQPPASGVPTFKERRPSYATGDTIHFGRDTIKVGPAKLVSFIQTDAGFVYTDVKGNVYFTDGTGDGKSDRKIGTGNSAHQLTADDDGTVVGWVQSRSPAPDENLLYDIVLYDVAADRVVARTGNGNGDDRDRPIWDDDYDPRVIAIDNDQAYLGERDGIHRWDLATGKDTMLEAGAVPWHLSDVANGQLAYTVDPTAASSGMVVAPTLGSTKATLDGQGGNLSPDGKHIFGGGNGSPLHSADGREIKLDGAGHQYFIFSSWLDNDRFTTVAKKSIDDSVTPFDLLTCSVKAAACTVAVPRFAPPMPDNRIPPGPQLPIGYSLSGS